MGVVISYDNDTILTLASTADYKLLTKNRTLLDDILVEYDAQDIPIDETTAIASDVAAGKYFFNSSGIKTLGTAPIVYNKLAENDFVVNTTSTYVTSIGTLSIGAENYTASKIIYVKVRDKAGTRGNYFSGSDTWFLNAYAANSATTLLETACRAITYVTGFFDQTQVVTDTYGDTTGYGIYAGSVSSAGVVTIYRKYDQSYSHMINGTYNVQVYGLQYAPDHGTPYNYTW